MDLVYTKDLTRYFQLALSNSFGKLTRLSQISNAKDPMTCPRCGSSIYFQTANQISPTETVIYRKCDACDYHEQFTTTDRGLIVK